METAKIQNINTPAVLREVFYHFSYSFLAGMVGAGFFVFAVWLPNLRLVFHTIVRGDLALSVKFTLLFNLLGSIQTNFSIFSASAMITIAILLGVNVAMTTYFLRKRGGGFNREGFLVSAGGLGSGIIGIGCAACGSIVLGSVLPVIGAAAIIALLPLKGKEFDILSIGLLITSVIMLARKIRAPVVCKPIYSDP